MRVTIVVKEHEFGLDVAKEDSVLDIKHKIEQILGASTESQTLSVLGWELVDGLDMEDYPIVVEGTRINLVIRSVEFDSRNSVKIPLVIKFSSKKIEVNVDITDTVRSLKEKIHIMDGTPLRRMALYFLGRELSEDYCNLVEYGIKESSEIVVFLKTWNRTKDDPPCEELLSVVVQTSSALLDSARFALEVTDSSTVGELTQLLLCRQILPIDDYIFIHKQRIMRDTCSLRWHGVENGDFLYVFKGSVSHQKQ
uniref:Ubiquitin-like domain-containing protein n=1 Tax=Kalanchoe fedtschenkoi TaxID=63787 RepID=A0A7N1A127_KALFE